MIAPQCPSCGNALTQLELEGMTMFACASCRGHWLDNAGSKLVVDGSLPERAREAARRPAQTRAQSAAGYRQSWRGETDSQRCCPFCQAPLAAATVRGAGVIVDACSEHGTWFDSAELHALAQHYEIALAEMDFEAKVLSETIDRATRAEARAKRRNYH